MATIALPSYQARVLFMGTNGTGKSWLASRMLRDYPRVIVVDLKGDFPNPWEKVQYIDKPQIGRSRQIEWQQPRIIYHPKPQYQRGRYPSIFLESMFRKAEKVGKKLPFILYIDEGLFLSTTSAKQWLQIIAVTGRSMGIGLWVASQRPRNIPVEVRTEAWAWYIFYLSYRADLKEVSDYSGGKLTVEDLEETLADHSFYEMKRQDGGKLAIAHYPPLKVEKSRKVK